VPVRPLTQSELNHTKLSKNRPAGTLPREKLRRLLTLLVELPPQIDEMANEIEVDASELDGHHAAIEELCEGSTLTPQAVSTAIYEHLEQSKHKLKIVSRADRAFRLHHDGKKRAEVRRGGCAEPSCLA
jgi:hypothetical protein